MSLFHYNACRRIFRDLMFRFKFAFGFELSCTDNSPTVTVCVHNNCWTIFSSEFKLPQNRFEFECDWPNGNFSTVCHRITIHQICRMAKRLFVTICNIVAMRLCFHRCL